MPSSRPKASRLVLPNWTRLGSLTTVLIYPSPNTPKPQRASSESELTVTAPSTSPPTRLRPLSTGTCRCRLLSAPSGTWTSVCLQATASPTPLEAVLESISRSSRTSWLGLLASTTAAPGPRRPQSSPKLLSRMVSVVS